MRQQQCPEIAVGALIEDREGSILLLRLQELHDQWIIPGGHIERGETMQEACRREVREETELEVGDLEFLCIHESIFDKDSRPDRHIIYVCFATSAAKSNVALNDGAQEYRWASARDAFKLPLEKYTKLTLCQYLTNKFS